MISSVFLGTPAASIPSLRALADGTELRLVVTRPDSPRGRSARARPSPVKVAAESLRIPVAAPASRLELHETLAGMAPVDVGVVAAFGMILSPGALAVPASGFLNVHFSLLPRWRGAAPVERAILSGDARTGVSLMAMDEGLDTGPVVAAEAVAIGETETGGELTDRLAELGGDLVTRHLADFVRGRLTPTPQPSDGVTYAHRITTDEANLKATSPSTDLLRAVRAFSPRPGARFANGRLKVWRACATDLAREDPGRLFLEGDLLCMGTGDRPIALLEVQAPGGRRMDGAAWARGHRSDLGPLS